MNHIGCKVICGSRQQWFDHYEPIKSPRDLCLGCLNPSVILSLEDFQLFFFFKCFFYLRLLTIIKNISILAWNSSVYPQGRTLWSSSCQLCSLWRIMDQKEGCGTCPRWCQGPSVAALAGHSLSGHKAHLDMHDESPLQCWQCGGEGWGLGGSLRRWH